MAIKSSYVHNSWIVQGLPGGVYFTVLVPFEWLMVDVCSLEWWISCMSTFAFCCSIHFSSTGATTSCVFLICDWASCAGCSIGKKSQSILNFLRLASALAISFSVVSQSKIPEIEQNNYIYIYSYNK